MSFLYEKETTKLPFYNSPTEKRKITKVNSVDTLHELEFYDELNIVKTAKAFKKYALK